MRGGGGLYGWAGGGWVVLARRRGGREGFAEDRSGVSRRGERGIGEGRVACGSRREIESFVSGGEDVVVRA